MNSDKHYFDEHYLMIGENISEGFIPKDGHLWFAIKESSNSSGKYLVYPLCEWDPIEINSLGVVSCRLKNEPIKDSKGRSVCKSDQNQSLWFYFPYKGKIEELVNIWTDIKMGFDKVRLTGMPYGHFPYEHIRKDYENGSLKIGICTLNYNRTEQFFIDIFYKDKYTTLPLIELTATCHPK